ncbi:MAG: hypothetical protein QM761_00145 [Pseudoxanthomonas sp.]
MKRGACLTLLWIAAAPARPQDAGADAPSEARDDATTLETIRVTAPPPETLDLYKFRNPIEVQGSAFDKHYHEPPTPEDISLNGGYILLGLNYGLMKAVQQTRRLPGYKDQIQSATARPPPLDEAQMTRAAQAWEVPAPTTPPAPGDAGDGKND